MFIVNFPVHHRVDPVDPAKEYHRNNNDNNNKHDGLSQCGKKVGGFSVDNFVFEIILKPRIMATLASSENFLATCTRERFIVTSLR